MLQTENADEIKTKPVLIHNFSNVGICLMLLCRSHHVLEIYLDYERWRMSSNRLISLM